MFSLARGPGITRIYCTYLCIICGQIYVWVGGEDKTTAMSPRADRINDICYNPRVESAVAKGGHGDRRKYSCSSVGSLCFLPLL